MTVPDWIYDSVFYQIFPDRFVEIQGGVADPGHRLPGQIIAGRAQSTGDDHQGTGFHGLAQLRLEDFKIIGNLHSPAGVKSQTPQLGPQKPEMSIEDSSFGQLCADRENGCVLSISHEGL